MRQSGSRRLSGSGEDALRRVLAGRREGRIRDLPDLSGLDARAVRKRLSVMRHDGTATWSAVFVPAKVGRPVEAISYVKLADPSRAGLRRFEAYCHEDGAVATAALVTGGYDYVLTGYFADVGAARTWQRELSLRPEVARVQQKIIQTRFGHALSGAPWF
ncbi:Lrp/AsnC family transcriptional regulator [Phenylobacterium sp. J426]|uniref:Lrp/AsnC family transcriptional regulator n=1 Tax=Phenylobacterium sp. J426 TaxID=2898439 RepID=UPI0021514860|nr:Lrp/AsnC family transcriptional regulator [Phenylobacterium sp. J426]MCR5876183.1 Lrp/AsnC family transcriptional regulator [Phenylobacterium sp. J426]